VSHDLSFFDKVYAITRLVPSGRITTYGAIARYLGAGQSARMVGWAMNASHNSDLFIPAHRVVNRFGLLSGKNHFGSADTMKELLESEGIKVIDDQVVDFHNLFWDPEKELGSDFR
jgi:methylated-DNA-protein-cysteine methyltransferase-like protein